MFMTSFMTSHRTRMHVPAAVIGIAVLLGAVGCGSATKDSATASSTSAAAPAAPAATSSAPTTTPTAAPGSGRSNLRNYTVTPSSSTGKSADGRFTWTLNVDTISGGDAKVADAFNNAVNAAAQARLDAVTPRADSDRNSSFDITPAISFSEASISELLIGVSITEGAAHPSSSVSTVVIDSRTATPITLKDLFTDEQRGLDRLSQQTKRLLPAVISSPPIDDEPGAAPTEANFKHWLPTAQGLEIHFEDYQFGHGLPVLTIPWADVDDLLAPGMTALRRF